MYDQDLLQKELAKHPIYNNELYPRVIQLPCGRPEAKAFLTTLVEEHNKYISDVKNAVAAAVRSKGRLFNIAKIFMEDDIDRIKEYIEKLDDVPDEAFRFSFAEKTMRTGLHILAGPVLAVVDFDHVDLIRYIKLSTDNAYHLTSGESIRYYQAYDIYDGLSIGDPFPASADIPTPRKMYAAVEIFKDQLASGKLVPDTWTLPIDSSEGNEEIRFGLRLINDAYALADVRTCKQCGHKFVLSSSEKQWYENKGYNLPCKCFTCRKNNRRSRRERERAEMYDDYNYPDSYEMYGY
jgi:hypothetical protein